MDFFEIKTVVRAKKSKSMSFFCKHDLAKIDEDSINSLKQLSEKNSNQNVRICLHDGPDSDFHDMVILQTPKIFYRPHKHPHKTETIHLIEGGLKIFIFNDSGDIADIGELSAGKGLIYRITKGYYHCVFPITDLAIFHESINGPFMGEEEALSPDWAPMEDAPDFHKFVNNIINS